MATLPTAHWAQILQVAWQWRETLATGSEACLTRRSETHGGRRIVSSRRYTRCEHAARTLALVARMPRERRAHAARKTEVGLLRGPKERDTQISLYLYDPLRSLEWGEVVYEQQYVNLKSTTMKSAIPHQASKAPMDARAILTELSEELHVPGAFHGRTMPNVLYDAAADGRRR
jgi:hypothetical protein